MQQHEIRAFSWVQGGTRRLETQRDTLPSRPTKFRPQMGRERTDLHSAIRLRLSPLEQGTPKIRRPLRRSSFLPLNPLLAAVEQVMKKIGHSSQRLLTLDEVAEYLNVNKFTVYRLLAQKDLPAFKVGNQWRFKRELVDAWLTKNAKNSQALSQAELFKAGQSSAQNGN